MPIVILGQKKKAPQNSCFTSKETVLFVLHKDAMQDGILLISFGERRELEPDLNTVLRQKAR